MEYRQLSDLVSIMKASRQFSVFLRSAMPQEATGAWQNYEPALEAAWNGDTPDAVATASWSVVDQAAADGVSQADLEMVAALASVSASSAPEWYQFEQSGGFECTTVDDCPLQMSVFQRGSYWRTVGMCDLLGAFVGALADGFAGAVVVGFLASVICGIALLF